MKIQSRSLFLSYGLKLGVIAMIAILAPLTSATAQTVTEWSFTQPNGYKRIYPTNPAQVVATSTTVCFGNNCYEQRVASIFRVPEETTPLSEWTVPAGISKVTFKVWGGGGHGGQGQGVASHVATVGGAAGGYSEKTVDVTPGQVFKIRVGQGGYCNYKFAWLCAPGISSNWSTYISTISQRAGVTKSSALSSYVVGPNSDTNIILGAGGGGGGISDKNGFMERNQYSMYAYGGGAYSWRWTLGAKGQHDASMTNDNLTFGNPGSFFNYWDTGYYGFNTSYFNTPGLTYYSPQSGHFFMLPSGGMGYGGDVNLQGLEPNRGYKCGTKKSSWGLSKKAVICAGEYGGSSPNGGAGGQTNKDFVACINHPSWSNLWTTPSYKDCLVYFPSSTYDGKQPGGGGGAGLYGPGGKGGDGMVTITAVNPNITASKNITALPGPCNTMNLSWESTSGALSYSLYRIDELIASVPQAAGTVTFTDTGLEPQDLYRYQYAIVTSSGTSSRSAPVYAYTSTTTGSCTDAPPVVDITGPSAGSPGITYTFDVSGIDPDNDQLYYEVDTNGDFAPDLRLPSAASSTVPSGTIRPVTYSWSSGGSKSLRAQATDTRGKKSAWAVKNITISGDDGLSSALSVVCSINESLSNPNTNPGPASATWEASASGGTGPYTFTWQNGETTGTSYTKQTYTVSTFKPTLNVRDSSVPPRSEDHQYCPTMTFGNVVSSDPISLQVSSEYGIGQTTSATRPFARVKKNSPFTITVKRGDSTEYSSCALSAKTSNSGWSGSINVVNPVSNNTLHENTTVEQPQIANTYTARCTPTDTNIPQRTASINVQALDITSTEI